MCSCYELADLRRIGSAESKKRFDFVFYTLGCAQHISYTIKLVPYANVVHHANDKMLKCKLVPYANVVHHVNDQMHVVLFTM